MVTRPRVSSGFALLAFLVSLTGCGGSSSATPSAPKADFLAANMDRSVNPGDDFFAYANGGWLKAHPIPASESGWGIGNVVREELYVNVRKINEDAAKANAAAGTDQQKIGDFWATAMDEAKAEQLGITPLKAELDRIDAIKTPKDALDVAFALRPLGVSAFFGVFVGQDEKNSDEMSVHLYQDGLGLPDRDYYFNTEAGVAKTRTEYVAHVARMLQLLGRQGEKSAANILAFETALAKRSRKLEDLRDPQKNSKKLSPDEETG